MSEGVLALLAVGAVAVAVLALLLVLWLALRLRRVARAVPAAGTATDASVERQLADERRRSEELRSEVAALTDHVRRVEADGQRAMARVGIVRFNPFEDTGGNQSFAVALLDARSDGLVLSSLHSRQGTRVYLKAVRGGQAESTLSDEETEALRRAAAGEDGRPG